MIAALFPLALAAFGLVLLAATGCCGSAYGPTDDELAAREYEDRLERHYESVEETQRDLGDCRDYDGDGHTTCDGDCDDTNPAVYVGALELCDGADNDCNGRWDEGCPDESETNWREVPE